MQPHQNLSNHSLDPTSTNSHSPLIKGSLEFKSFSSRSPISSGHRRRLSRTQNQSEIAEFSQPYAFSGPAFVPISDSRGKVNSTPSTPIKVKEEYPLGDFTAGSKYSNMLCRPFESPFPGLHKDSRWDSSPCNFQSPGWNARFQPLPADQNMTYSPFRDLNSSTRHDDHMNSHDYKDSENNTFSLTFWEDVSTQQTQIKLPSTKSRYNTLSMVPSQTRTHEIFFNNTQDSKVHEETRYHVEDERMNQNHSHTTGEKYLRTPSPTGLNRKIKLDSMNSFSSQLNRLESTTVRKVVMPEGHINSCETSVMRTKLEQGEEDDFQLQEEFSTLKKKIKVCCNCKKSRCLKLYCDCFNRGEPCSKECNCVNCYNNEAHAHERNEAMMAVLEKNPTAFKPKVNKTDSPERVGEVRHMRGCNCKKSGCQKRYCECYQAGVKCTELCKCEQCKNMDSCCRFKRAQNYSLVNFGSEDSLPMSIPFSDTKALKNYVRHNRNHEEGCNHRKDDEDYSHYHDSRAQLVYSQPGPSYFTDLPVSKKRKLDMSVSEFTPKRTLVFLKEEPGEEEPCIPEDSESVIHIHRDKKKGITHLRAHTDKKAVKVQEISECPTNLSQQSVRRTKRNKRPSNHFDSDEYELRK